MPEDLQLVPQAKQALLRLRDADGRADLIDRLAEFFPHSDDSWLTSDGDESFREAFHLEQQSSPSGDVIGGWLEPAQHSEFWGYIRDGADTGQLASFLDRLLSAWEMAALTQADYQGDLADLIEETRFVDIGPVDGYPGWWQGYDCVEGVWKYARSGDIAPDDQTDDWLIGSVAFPESYAADAAHQSVASASPEEHAQAVYELVLTEVIEPTATELEQLWSNVWVRVHAAHESGAAWTTAKAAAIADEVLTEHYARLLDEPEEVSADELIAEIQAIRSILIEHAKS